MKKRAEELRAHSTVAVAALFILINVMILLLVASVAVRHDQDEALDDQLELLAEDTVRKLELVMNGHMARLERLGRVVRAAGPDAEAAVEALLIEPGGMEMLFLAPRCVVARVLPAGAGHGPAPGADCLTEGVDDLSRAAVALARPVLAGPFPDPESGDGYLAARIPVLDGEAVWGLLGMELSCRTLFQAAFLDEPTKHGFDLVVRRAHDESPEGVIWSSGPEPDRASGVAPLRSHGLRWEVLASRRITPHDRIYSWLYGVGVVVMCLLVAGLAYHYMHLRRIKALMESMAMTDPLTGLPNRRSLMVTLGQVLASARRTGQPLVILYLDLNGFKQVNDYHGHDKGDRVLKRTADVLRESVGERGIVSRVGGDEFVIILEGMSRGKKLDRVVEILSKRLEMGVGGGSENGEQRDHDTTVLVHVSASFGIAVFPEDGHDVEALLHRADVQMYSSKRLYKDSRRMEPFKPTFR